MVLCKFWSKGNCKFGGSCRFEHPTSDPIRQASYNEKLAPSHQESQDIFRFCQQYGISKDYIKADLTVERPAWVLSCYGPGKQTPTQLFGGSPREQSFEEIRLRFYQLKADGNITQAIREADALTIDAQRQINTALNDPEGAIRFLLSGESHHPNRVDICQAAMQMSVMPASRLNTQDFAALSPFSILKKPSPAQSSAPQLDTFSQVPRSVGPTSSLQEVMFRTQATGNVRDQKFIGTSTSSQSPNPFASTRAAKEAAFTQRPFAHETSSQGGLRKPIIIQSDDGLSKDPIWLEQSSKESQNQVSTQHGARTSDFEGIPCKKRVDGEWERVWFQEPPTWKKELNWPIENDETNNKKAYDYVTTHGIFMDDRMPDVPPKTEWCRWNF